MNSKELKRKMAELPTLDMAPNHPWSRHRYELRQHCQRGNIGSFLTWSTMIATMVVLDAPYVKGEFHDTPHWLIPEEVDFGGIQRLPWAQWTSGNAVHQAYHLWQWLRHSGKSIGELDRVFEFGGGYGAMCRMFREQGFEGEYLIYDFPECLLLQEYYLSNTTHGDIKFLAELPAVEADLFIGLYSMSEADMKTRNAALAAVPAKSYLFAYQKTFKDYDNLGWFGGLPNRCPELKWELWASTHLGRNHHYAVGISC